MKDAYGRFVSNMYKPRERAQAADLTATMPSKNRTRQTWTTLFKITYTYLP